jgi:hypothetical protein
MLQAIGWWLEQFVLFAREYLSVRILKVFSERAKPE